MARLVYTRHYNIGFLGVERLHPFDSRKYGRAWQRLSKHFGRRLSALQITPDRQASREELLLVHTPEYLEQLLDSGYLAQALEIPALRRVPQWMLDWRVLRPMRWATRGTILAAQAALEHGFAVNLSGGYHHAKPDRGEGFSIYADIAVAVAALRADGALGEADRVVSIDADAHQGNGVCHTFMRDRRVFILDIYNSRIYPKWDVAARDRIDADLGLTPPSSDTQYMKELQSCLPGFLRSVQNAPIGLAIYNAGTDVLAGDPLGGLNISAATILERDLYIVGELRKRGIPTIMLLSGGYTPQSYQLIADSVIRLLEEHALEP